MSNIHTLRTLIFRDAGDEERLVRTIRNRKDDLVKLEEELSQVRRRLDINRSKLDELYGKNKP